MYEFDEYCLNILDGISLYRQYFPQFMGFVCLQIYLHGRDLKSLHAFISPDILPAEYGGKKPSFDNRTWRLSLLANEDKCIGEYTASLPPRELTPIRGEVCAPRWHRELCRRERKLLVISPMSGRSKGRGQTKCSPWSFRLGVGREVNNLIPKDLPLPNLRTYWGGQWRRPRPKNNCNTSKEKDIMSLITNRT
jgi:hypothetical protein